MTNTERRIYCDYAAATPVDPAVLEVMQPWLTTQFANASSTHAEGQLARRAIDDTRRNIAVQLGAAWHEVVFMSSGTESANAAIFGVARERRRTTGAPVHVVTTNIEHHAVLDAMQQLEIEGNEVTYVPAGPNGVVAPEDIIAALRPNTVLVSVMLANNEIGTIQPVAEIAAAVKAAQPDVRVHTDACQAGNYIQLNVQDLGVDLLTVNSSKIYGPKGAALLYVRSGVVLQPLTFGGGQEFALRPGTENVAAITGFAHAFVAAQHAQQQQQEATRMLQLRNTFTQTLLANLQGTEVNGANADRLPNNANIFFPGVDGDIFLFELDQAGIAASLGSACTAGSIDPSHVLTAIGRTPEDARRCVRFTFGRNTTAADIEDLVERIRGVYSTAFHS